MVSSPTFDIKDAVKDSKPRQNSDRCWLRLFVSARKWGAAGEPDIFTAGNSSKSPDALMAVTAQHRLPVSSSKISRGPVAGRFRPVRPCNISDPLPPPPQREREKETSKKTYSGAGRTLSHDLHSERKAGHQSHARLNQGCFETFFWPKSLGADGLESKTLLYRHLTVEAAFGSAHAIVQPRNRTNGGEGRKHADAPALPRDSPLSCGNYAPYPPSPMPPDTLYQKSGVRRDSHALATAFVAIVKTGDLRIVGRPE